MEAFKTLDWFPKTLEDFRTRTTSGAIISLISGAFILLLFVSELSHYMQSHPQAEFLVDVSRGEKLKINIDVSFPNLPCAYLSVDAMDVTGETQLDIVHNIFKKRLDAKGRPIGVAVKETELKTPATQAVAVPATTTEEKPAETAETAPHLQPGYCGSCFGAGDPGQCCNTCEQVREAYRKQGWAFSAADHMEQCVREGFTEKLQAQKNEGCNIYGYLQVNKVAGNFHFAPGKSFQQHHMHVHDLSTFKNEKFNLSHTINRLSFGQDFPGLVNPLDAVAQSSEAPNMMYQYFIKIVPTVYSSKSTSINTNQFSVTENSRTLDGGHGGLPGVFFLYDYSAMMVKYSERQKSFGHFLTSVCAIIGGVFTVAGMVDSIWFHSIRSLRAKVELGKAS